MTKGETLPLDGMNLWSALVNGATSPRTDIYYGVNQKLEGPAVRDVKGFKLILGNGGGGKGEWSPKQLPNRILLADSASNQSSDSDGKLLYSLPDDVGERNPLAIQKNVQTVNRLQSIIDKYEATKVPQLMGDPNCPRFQPRDSPKGPWIGPYCDGAPTPAPLSPRPPVPPPAPQPPVPPSPQPPVPSRCGTCKVCFNPTIHKCQADGAHHPKTKAACEAKGHMWCGPSWTTFEAYV